MSVVLTDQRGLGLSTDYPIDKITGYSVGSITIPSLSSATPTVGHGLTYKPLYILKWSTSPAFDISYDEIGVSTSNNLQLNARTDGTTLYLFAQNNTGTSVTLYYRVIYFMPPDISQQAAATVSSFDKFVLNVDFNYTKVFTEGLLPAGAGSIAHNLGYYPQVEVWYIRTSDGMCVHCVDSDVSATSQPRCEVTTSGINLVNSGTVASAWYYKIYVDEV